jgi:hypothetical protein
MVGLIVFHVLMGVLGVGILSGVVPTELVTTMLGYLHNTIGISTPPEKQVRTIALVWIGSMIVIVDGCLLLLVFITSLLK